MQVPSGIVYTTADLDLLLEMASVGFVRHSETQFKLKSGIMSNVYVFGREDLTDHPELEWLIGRKIAQVVYGDFWTYESEQQCLIGIPTAGNALAQAAAMASVEVRKKYSPKMPSIAHRIMREQLKQHGAHQGWVNGRPDARQHYWLVDNVATDGQSKLEAAKKLEADDYPAKNMPCLIWVDRQQGAVPRLKAAGFEHVIVVYNLLDITFALGELRIWPKETVKAVEEEIAAHQFKV
jgi:orotate phosphoribosyltransferase